MTGKEYNMKILITGSKGMLGYDLVKRLRTDHTVVGIDVDNFDIVDKKIVDYIEHKKPAIIFHLAAFTNVDEAEVEKEKAYNINVKGTENIVKAAKQLDIPIVFISTDYVFDGSKDSSYNETDVTNPINFYGKTKEIAEGIVKNTLKKYFIVRTSWLFGKNGKNFVKTIIRHAKEKDKIEVVDDQVGSPTYTFDLSISLALLVDSSQYGIYHITNSGECSWYDFARKIVEILGLQTSVVPIESRKLERLAKRPRNSVLDNNLFIKTFNHRMPDWDDALKRYIINTNKKE